MIINIVGFIGCGKSTLIKDIQNKFLTNDDNNLFNVKYLNLDFFCKTINKEKDEILKTISVNDSIGIFYEKLKRLDAIYHDSVIGKLKELNDSEEVYVVESSIVSYITEILQICTFNIFYKYDFSLGDSKNRIAYRAHSSSENYEEIENKVKIQQIVAECQHITYDKIKHNIPNITICTGVKSNSNSVLIENIEILISNYYKSFEEKEKTESVAVYIGSFLPYTVGHHNIFKQAKNSNLFDEIKVIRAINQDKNIDNKWKNAVEGLAIQEFDGFAVDLLNDLTKTYKNVIIIRGLRNMLDFNEEIAYREHIRTFAPNVSIMYFMCDTENLYVSSSMVRKLKPEMVDRYIIRSVDD